MPKIHRKMSKYIASNTNILYTLERHMMARKAVNLQYVRHVQNVMFNTAKITLTG